MRMMRYRGLLVIVLWQTVPVSPVRDEAGRTRLAFGYANGQYEDVTLDCAGNVLQSSLVRVRSGGVAIDRWVSDRIRVAAYGGVIAGDQEDWNGGYGGLLVAREGKNFGIGGGISSLPIEGENRTLPSLYIRAGELDRVHFRADLLPAEPNLGASGLARAGIGFNEGLGRGASGIIGLAVCYFCLEEANGGAFALGAVPLTRRFDLTGQLLYGPGQEKTSWNLGFGGRINFR